ncbi:hypothetical protein ACFWUW_14495 [Streptomyces sp. NPDC058655]|uniref:hypothetical protein n=1 Tax=Streptomyces sp. NPDC058655 TaxID=3346577 RepID=UPI003666C7E8
MAQDRRSARHEPVDPDTAERDRATADRDRATADRDRDAFAAGDANELLDEDGKAVLEGRGAPLKDLHPEQVGK